VGWGGVGWGGVGWGGGGVGWGGVGGGGEQALEFSTVREEFSTQQGTQQ
jgi:hypothetical protein